LTNGSIGVFFNDSTTIILAGNQQWEVESNNPEIFRWQHFIHLIRHFEYLSFDRQNTKSTLIRACHTLSDYPSELRKKVTLLCHFQNYITDNLSKVRLSMLVAVIPDIWPLLQIIPSYFELDTKRIQDLDFLTKYIRTKHAVLFRLSNRVLQVNFFDHTKLVLYSEGKMMSFVDQSKEIRSRPLADFVDEGEPTVMKRINYVRDVLRSLCSVWKLILFIPLTWKAPESESASFREGDSRRLFNPTYTMPSYSSASASELDEDDLQGILRRRLRPRRTDDTEQQPFEQGGEQLLVPRLSGLLIEADRPPDTLSALIVPSCILTISDHAEESAVPIALPENMTTVTALSVPAISQTVNEHIEIPHFRLLDAAELAALGTKGRKSRDDSQVGIPEQTTIRGAFSVFALLWTGHLTDVSASCLATIVET